MVHVHLRAPSSSHPRGLSADQEAEVLVGVQSPPNPHTPTLSEQPLVVKVELMIG